MPRRRNVHNNQSCKLADMTSELYVLQDLEAFKLAKTRRVEGEMVEQEPKCRRLWKLRGQRRWNIYQQYWRSLHRHIRGNRACDTDANIRVLVGTSQNYHANLGKSFIRLKCNVMSSCFRFYKYKKPMSQISSSIDTTPPPATIQQVSSRISQPARRGAAAGSKPSDNDMMTHDGRK